MSLLMEALRKAEDAKKKSEDGSVVENHADEPPKIDLSQIEDLELSDLQPAAPHKRDNAAEPTSDGFPSVPPMAEEAPALSVALDYGASQDQGQILVLAPQAEDSQGASAQITLEPLDQPPQTDSEDLLSQPRTPDTAADGDLSECSPMAQGADLIAEFDREFTSPAEQPGGLHDDPEKLERAASLAPPQPVSQPAQRASPAPSRSSAQVNSPAVQSRQEMHPAPATSVNESPARAAAVLAAGGGKNPRTRRVVLASVGVLVLALSLGGGYVYYEQSRLAVSIVPHPLPVSTPGMEQSNLASEEASLAMEPAVLEPATGSAQEQAQQNNLAGSEMPLLETDTPVDESVPAPASVSATQDVASLRRDEAEHTLTDISDSHAVVAGEQKAVDAAEKASASVVAPQTESKPSSVTTTAAVLPPAPPRDTFLSRQPPQQDLLHATLLSAYGAYQRGDDETALRLYQQALTQAPTNRDGLLGLAAVMLRKGDIQQAQLLYTEVLRAYPGDKLATAGLVSLTAASDPVRAESEIKYLLAQDPTAASLHFLLGNVYARQNKWSEAQAAYFNAYRLDNRNADYAFNLAVGLDRIGAHNQALSYYQTALQLASNGSASFDLAAVNQRLHRLERQVAKGNAP